MVSTWQRLDCSPFISITVKAPGLHKATGGPCSAFTTSTQQTKTPHARQGLQQTLTIPKISFLGQGSCFCLTPQPYALRLPTEGHWMVNPWSTAQRTSRWKAVLSHADNRRDCLQGLRLSARISVRPGPQDFAAGSCCTCRAGNWPQATLVASLYRGNR